MGTSLPAKLRRGAIPLSAKARQSPCAFFYGLYKIGLSKDVRARIKTLGVALPFEIEPIHTIKTDDMVTLEKELHAQFNEKRVRGEWFALTPEDVEYVRSL